jgi:hypothetical protein
MWYSVMNFLGESCGVLMTIFVLLFASYLTIKWVKWCWFH